MPPVGVVEPGDAEARRPPQGFVALRVESKVQRVLLPARFGERHSREVDAFDKTGLFRERRFGQPGPGARAHDLGGGEEAVVLAARVLFSESKAPGELASGVVPRGFIVRLELAADGGLELVEAPLAREEPRDGIDPVSRQVGDPVARDPGPRSRSVEESSGLLRDLGRQIEAVRQRERDGKPVVNL